MGDRTGSGRITRAPRGPGPQNFQRHRSVSHVNLVEGGIEVHENAPNYFGHNEPRRAQSTQRNGPRDRNGPFVMPRNNGNPDTWRQNLQHNHVAQANTYRPPYCRNPQPRKDDRDGAPNQDHHRNHQNYENRRRGQQQNFTRKFHVGFKILEQWSEQDPDVIITALISHKTGFEELLETNLTNDYIVLVVKVLAKMCSSAFNANKSEIMNLISQEKFIMQLYNYITQLSLQDAEDRRRNAYFWKDIDGFFTNLIIMCESFINTIPTRACEVLPKLLKSIIVIGIPTFEVQQNQQINPEIKDKFEKLQTKVELHRAEMAKKKKEGTYNTLHDEAPPNDFRQLTVYPTSEEILTNARPFVREHIIKGAYHDVDHYLDVQFRLLKEDFVAPLREGVNAYIHQDPSEKRKISNVRIHGHVEFISPKFNRDQVGVLVQFDQKKKSNVNFKYSRRFMYGSLVCFTRDNFHTLLFGKIIERDAKLLEEKQIVVGFEPGYDNYELNQPYVMVECSVYFEPYYHVLRALQNMEEENFPMKNYIIDVNPAIQPPNYLRQEGVYKIKEYSVPLFVPGAWPSEQDLGFDNTQYTAFKAALTEKFVVIQGPPGTGKTYLGLQVAKTLIKNKEYWYSDWQTPILVVCFTNHALDQFLEGLIGTTKRIVRVGGQSKNKNMEQFNLREKRKCVSVNGQVNSALYNIRSELGTQLSKIKMLSDALDEIYKYRSVVNFKHFCNIDRDFSSSWFATASDKAIKEWLFGGRTRQERQYEAQGARLAEMQQLEQQEQQNNNADVELDEVLDAQNRAEQGNEDDIDLLELLGVESVNTTYLTSVSDLERVIKYIQTDLGKLANDTNEQAVFNKKWELERQLYETEDDLQYLMYCLNEGRNFRATRKPFDANLNRPQNMAPEDRWRLYFYWLHWYRQSLIKQLTDLQEVYREKYSQYMELKDIDDTRIMREMLVVGMTTTGAARLQTTLQALKCRIVIVEEAAEVLESHIIVSLTRHCEHLILIGDHQQLRPSTANFQMETKYNLGISLFERMVQNEVQCHVLGVQHRMRPEIAKLIVPAIYPVLENHSSVLNFPPVWGVDPCMYFIHHNYREDEAGDSSKLNLHEAKFIINLARYLIQNGYQPEDITILAAYSGQMFALWRERKRDQLLLQDVRITVLDNYQGEESKIILLSLVRNNEDNRIGFLKIENRVCVALSRAKEGFYIMGNMDLLCQNSQIWPKIKMSLEDQEFLGDSLALRCQIHTEEVTRVKTAKDFKNVSEGGCKKICDVEMDCGHRCTRLCHIIDRVHDATKCKAPCLKILCTNDHPCPKMCYEECGFCQVPMKTILPCSHEHAIPCFMDPADYKCPTLIQAQLPCGHTVTNKPCHKETETYRCPFPCDTRVEPCGHQCLKQCHVQYDPDHLEYKCVKQCARPRKGCSTQTHMCPNPCYQDCPPCEIVIQKIRTVCVHRFSVACNTDVDSVECHKPCVKDLPCGHRCRKKCYEPCGDCQQMVNKVIPECNHTVKAKCSEEPNRWMCRGKCPLKLNCGHICQNKCDQVCTTQCRELVDHNKNVDCGHKFQIECHMLSKDYSSNDYKLLNFCRQPCTATLQCKHKCSGTCGPCAQGRIHISCKEKCGVPLICGHECPIPCRGTCQPCTKNCSYRCKHSKCNKKCGDPCTKCPERCERRCRHIRCNAKCGDKCQVPPCTEPCEKSLKCGHPCVGYCGDPCPPLCRVCNKEELTEVFLGFEDEEDARFVCLDECKHVIEGQGMDRWLRQGGNEINYKSCPKCKKPLTSTQRYSDYIKAALRDVSAVKKKFFGSVKENERKRADLLRRVNDLITNSARLQIKAPYLRNVLENFEILLAPVRKNKRQPLNMLLARTLTSKIQIVENITDIWRSAKLKNADACVKASRQADFLFKFVMRQKQIQTDQDLMDAPRVTNQEIIDFQMELKRFSRIVQLCQIEDCDKFKPVIASQPATKAAHEQINDQLFSIAAYSDKLHNDLKEQLIKFGKEIQDSFVITDKERQEIVRAMGMGSGHWFKCPNGHYYAIGECGGAMQMSRCNECGAQIGGSNHRLLPNNRHAGEMDGSRYAAFSETANNLFNFREFRNDML